MGITEYFSFRAKRIPPTLPNRSSNSYEDMTSARHPAPDPPIALGPSHNPKARRIPWFTFLPVHICTAAYATHSYYRRHRPLRRPALTPLRLSEIYIVAGAVLTMIMDGMVMQRNMIYHDENLLVVELAAYRVRAVMRHPENLAFQEKVKNALGELKDAIPWLRLRNDTYNACSFWQKAVWWHDNLWSDEPTWISTALMTLVGAKGMRVHDALVPDTDPDDWVRCVTHLTNRVREEDIGGYALYPFLLSIPVAMLARWTRRPAVYLPINGLQRLLLGVGIYCGEWRVHRRLSSLQNIQERRKAAMTMKHVLHHEFEEEIAHCRMWGTIIGPYNSVF
ncbi:hypothetical protein LXA43DRAFT_702744 [Ganoderma leucocontextum]|nr:hypothetical protein LXA43DRAFT_702744 [Ganoderma leucocontextum]